MTRVVGYRGYRGDGAITNDRCYREVTPEGTRSILCDMHRDGGPDAVGEKCPYYCDREVCRKPGLYGVEDGTYCAGCAVLVLQEVVKADGVEGMLEVAYEDQRSSNTTEELPDCCKVSISTTGRPCWPTCQVIPQALSDVDCPACAGVPCTHICPGKYGSRAFAPGASRQMKPVELFPSVEVTRYSKEHLAAALTWIEQNCSYTGTQIVARALAETSK